MSFQRFARLVFAVSVTAILVSPRVTVAADFSLKVIEKPAPKEIGETIRAVLQPKAIQLLNGDKPAWEIWPRTELPLKSKPASANDALSAVPEATLVAVVAVSDSGFRD